MFLRELKSGVGLAAVTALAMALCTTGVAKANIIYVDDDAPAGGDGTSWGTAFASLQNALAIATSADEIRIAGGKYLPTARTNPSNPRSATFSLVNGVKLRGGYAGLADPGDPDERDFGAYETILSGDLSGDDDPNDLFAHVADNAEHVVTAVNVDSTTYLDGVTITGGNAGVVGGALLCQGASPVVSRCLFVNNAALGIGGAMMNIGGSPTITTSTFRGNHADAGAALVTFTFLDIVNCGFFDNVAGGSGGAVRTSGADLHAVNCTWANNSAGYDGGAVYIDTETYLSHFENCILWGNTAPTGSQIWTARRLRVDYCDIQDGQAGIYTGGGWPDWGDGNIAYDPFFTDPAAGDFTLSLQSPCIDIGDNAALPPDTLDLDDDGDPNEPLPIDLAGNARVVDGNDDGTAIVDMGAYERPESHLADMYVDDDAPAGGDGASWNSALSDLQLALLLALTDPEIKEIRVAGGLYKPANKTQSFTVPSGVEVYGGYAGLANPGDPDSRDLVTYETVLSGDLLGNDDPNNLFANRSDNCYHVVTASNTAATTRLDGVTITGGYAPSGQRGGGGVYMMDGSATFAQCTIRHNVAIPTGVPIVPPAGCGAGVCAVGGTPVFTSCAIHHNTTGTAGNGGHGGGLCFVGSSPTLVDCAIHDNRSGDGQDNIGGSGGNGAGLYAASSSDLNLVRCTFSSNVAGAGGDGVLPNIDAGPGGHGGGLYVDTSTCTLNDCDLLSNHAGSGGASPGQEYPYGGPRGGAGGHGGAIFCANGDLTLLACTVRQNTAGNGGISGDYLAGNGGNGGGLYVSLGSLDMSSTELTANAAGEGGDAESDPQYMSYGSGGIGGSGGAAFVSGATTVTLADCVLTLNNAGDGGRSGYTSGDPVYAGGPGGNGGALYCASAGWLELLACTVTDNAAGDGGPAIDGAKGSLALHTAPNSSLESRSVGLGDGGDGGAAFIADSSGIVRDCHVARNAAGNAGGCGWGICDGGRGGDGGGLSVSGATSSIEFARCLLENNTAGNGAQAGMHQGVGGRGGNGGAINAIGATSNISLVDCLLARNTAGNGAIGGADWGVIGAAGQPGGLLLEGTGLVVNCTIAGNAAGLPGQGGTPAVAGGLRLATGSAVQVHNDVLWVNTASSGTTEQNQLYGTPTQIGHSCVQGWTGTLGGVGNIGDDPLFLDPNAADYHLSAGSPCIDAGNNAYVGLFDVDLDGNDRRVDDPATADCPLGGCGTAPIVDMGCYEFGAPFVDCNANGVPDNLDPGICRGDANCDGQVEFGDINAFVDALLNGVYCDGTGLNVDCGRDCSVGFDDINPFVALLTTNTLPIMCP